MNRAFRLAYDGRAFHGFQRQPDVPTVENAVFKALRDLGICADSPDRYSAAGRTDAGASAVAQTITFDCPEWCTPHTLNAELPGAIRAWAAADVPKDFHATHDATVREYTYHCYAPTADATRAEEAAAELSGEHDFHNLTTDTTGTTRDLALATELDRDYLVLTATASGFPRGLVRRLASLIRAIATGTAPVSKATRVLDSEPVTGAEGIPVAPAYPLVLTGVEYDIEFTPHPRARTDTLDRFDDRRVEHTTIARVAETITAAL